MGRPLRLALLALALFTSSAHAGPLTDSCRGVNEALHGPCRAGEQAVSYASAITGLSAVDVSSYEGSWVNRAHGLQYDLAGDVPLRNAPWVGTHNSFNSVAEMGPTLSDFDSNQQLTLVDQLRIDVRSLELDVHWFPGLRNGSVERAPVVCHARGAGEGHAGCTIENTLDVTLAPVAQWLAGNPGQVLLVYLEDHLEDAAGHAAGAAAVERTLGERVYRPPSAGAACHQLPLELTRDDVLAAGKQVVIVSGCGVGAAWRSVAFDWSSPVHVESRPRGFRDFPDCGPDFDRDTYDSRIVRYFEDSTALTAGASTVGAQTVDDGITPATAAAMARCGVDLTGMDQLLPGDGRLDALVWSWERDQPAADGGDCAVQAPGGRWHARACGERHRVACRASDGTWTVAGPPVPAAAAPARCGAAEHAVPRTGFENELLELAAGGSEVWLGQRRQGDGWTALDAR